MGRAGSGSGGGGHSSGGHSSSRSSGGHSSSSGSLHSSSSGHRAGSGSRTSSGGSFSSSSRPRGNYSSPRPSQGGMGRPMGGSSRGGAPGGGFRGGFPRGGLSGGGFRGGPPPGSPRNYSYDRDGYRGRRSGIFSYVVAAIIILFALFLVLGNRGKADTQKSTIVRTKLESVSGFDSNCVIDELDWVDNVSKTESRLKEFFSKTGVQPYILLRDYDPSLVTDAEKETWALDYYEENIDREDAFLFVYFAEKDTDNDVGYMAYVNGLMTSSVMDSEAVDIFWNNLDRYWYTNMSTDDVLVSAFVDTGKTIMKVPTNGWDVLKIIIIFVGVIAVLYIILVMIVVKAQRAKQKAEEDQRILETDINNYLK